MQNRTVDKLKQIESFVGVATKGSLTAAAKAEVDKVLDKHKSDNLDDWQMRNQIEGELGAALKPFIDAFAHDAGEPTYADAYARAGFGDLILLLAASLFSLYTVIAKPLVTKYGPLNLMCYSLLFGAPPMLLLTLNAFVDAPLAQVSAGVWFATFALVVLSRFVRLPALGALGWIRRRQAA